MNRTGDVDFREIRSFPQLVVYLRDQLDWPIERESFDDLTFDYSPDELGIDAKTAAKIQEIKQLRPLKSDQPWGIFFVKFEPRKLPVLALRRILGRLVLRKRASANASDRKGWDKNDLLFISSFGEGDDRQISFAHFTDNEEHGDLPTLKVLGWDEDDTPLKLDHVQRELKGKMRWPENGDVANWRRTWASAFTLRHLEVISTSKQLAVALADLARNTRKRVNAALKIETDQGPLTTLMNAFREALIHDLEPDDFADMYAQTIAYGLLSARVSRHAPDDNAGTLVADNLVDMVPITNPFLKELMETFLNIGGRKWNTRRGRITGIDFDELGVNDVVDLLRRTNMEAVLRDFGNRAPDEDPVIHFYELFLKEYDAKKRMQRGVFYTPKPVVSYIVRSVHELLQTEFGLPDGLADTTTWGEMIARNAPSPSEGEGRGEGAPRLKLPTIKVKKPNSPDLIDQPIDPTTPFVQILDPATGTATFLVEVIDIIHKTMLAKWKKAGHMELEIPALWNEYVPKHLLPRLYGYELMMAPYAIAHMKIGLKLFETGYKFGSGERARIFLTNALEPPQDFSETFEQMAPALAHEAQQVNDVKRYRRFTVVIGNPPYAVEGFNKNDWIDELMRTYKEDVRDEHNIQLLGDDYAKFLRFAHYTIQCAGSGAIGMITKNTYINTSAFRGLRRRIVEDFGSTSLLDLHGKLYGKTPSGSIDTNVFEIRVGVSILLARSLIVPSRDASDSFSHSELYGLGDEKLTSLSGRTSAKTVWSKVPIDRRNWILEPLASGAEVDEYYKFTPLLHLATGDRDGSQQGKRWGGGVKTNRDYLLVAFTRAELEKRLGLLASKDIGDSAVMETLGLKDGPYWNTARERKKIRGIAWRERIFPYFYGPFDVRWVAHIPQLIEIGRGGAVKHLMRHLQVLQPPALVLKRRNLDAEYHHATVTRHTVDINSLNGQTYVIPSLLVLSDNTLLTEGASGQSSNLAPGEEIIRGCIPNEAVNGQAVLAYIYSLLHSPTYRVRYGGELRKEFPYIPLPGGSALFSELSIAGSTLIDLHLLESPRLERLLTTVRGVTNHEIEKPTYANGTVWLDRKQTCGFAGVPEAVWNFHIGGYQVCEKWLKDRKGRRLSKDDIAHYQKIVVALSETIRLMKEIDETIEKHGGWPGAFVTTPIAQSSGSAHPETSQPAASARRSRPTEAVTDDDSDGGEGLFQLRAENPVKQGRLFEPTINDEAPPPEERNREQNETRSIDDISNFDVMIAVRAVFNDGQTRDRDAAIRDVARELGFQRVGDRIQERLDGDLRAAVQRGILLNDRGELAIDCRSIGDYPRDLLTKMLTAGMGNAWWDREELITSTARYLGFARTGPAIRDAFKSIINGAIRKGLLESDGGRVRKL